MLSVQKLVAGYAGSEVLHGIDLQVKSGEIVALIGPNGSGKSTLLKSIFSLCDVNSGRVLFNNQDVTKLETHKMISQGIGFVSQGRPVFSTMSVVENLEMGAFGVSDSSVVNKRLDTVVSKFSVLNPKRFDLALTLSGGQQQLLAIGRALMNNPKLLLLDEPSLGLSPKAAKDVFEQIRQLNQIDGVGILIAEQNARQAVELADRTYVLVDGLVAFCGGKEVLNDPRIQQVYLGGR